MVQKRSPAFFLMIKDGTDDVTGIQQYRFLDCRSTLATPKSFNWLTHLKSTFLIAEITMGWMNGNVYDLDTLSTFVSQDNVRAIVYDEVVCLDGPVPVQEIFILKNWYRDVLVVRLPILSHSQVQGYLLVNNHTNIIVPACVLPVSQHSATINDVFDGFIGIST